MTTSAAAHDASDQLAARRRRRRVWLFRLLAVCLSLLPLLLFELVSWASGWSAAGAGDDPLAGFAEIRPLFVTDASGTRHEIPKSRQAYFRPESFLAVKPENEFRIFVLGGSTVQGNPFTIETAFSSWLEQSLNAEDPRFVWNCVNCGGISYASYRLVPILREVLRYQPDLVIVYTGHNEFLEQRTFADLRERDAMTSRWIAAASQLRTFQLLRHAMRSAQGQPAVATPREILPAEVDALLDQEGALADYHFDQDERALTVAEFEQNLSAMSADCRLAGVPLLLCVPACRLRDCPPFKSEPVVLAEQTTAANEVYVSAQSADARANFAAAHEGYVLARDLDACPLRATTDIQGAVRSVARRENVPLVDAAALFAAASAEGIAGPDWFLDHVHPSIEGHQLLTDWLLDEMQRQGWFVPVAGQSAARQARYAEQLQRMPTAYFVAGQKRLEALNRWATGRGDDLRKPSPGAREEVAVEPNLAP